MREYSLIGYREVWGQPSDVPLPITVRTSHLYAIGQTGTGKSTLLANLLHEDAMAGRGFALLDPHGDLARFALLLIPRARTDHICYLDPTDSRPVGFNPLQDARDPALRPLVVDAIVASLRAVWRDSWGPRLEYILAHALTTLAEVPDTSMLGLLRLFSDDHWRRRVVNRTTDPLVRRFWEEFASWDKRLRSEAVAPVLNKVGTLFLSPYARHVLCQPTSRFSPLFALQRRRILIANLAKGTVGETLASLLGSLLLSAFLFAAFRRGATKEVYPLYVDEFHAFTTDAFVPLLSEARKYGLALSLFHQFVAQVPERVQQAVFGNVGTFVVLRVSAHDAPLLSRVLEVPEEHLLVLGNYEAYLRTPDQSAHRISLLPPPPPIVATIDNAREQSRMRFGRPLDRVIASVHRQMGIGQPSRRPE